MSITILDIKDFLISSNIHNIEMKDIRFDSGNPRIQYFHLNNKYSKTYEIMEKYSYSNKSDPLSYCKSGIHAEIIIRGNKLYNGIHFENSFFNKLNNDQLFDKIITDFESCLKREFSLNSQNKIIKRNHGKNNHGKQIEIDCNILTSTNQLTFLDKDKINRSITLLFKNLESVLP